MANMVKIQTTRPIMRGGKIIPMGDVFEIPTSELEQYCKRYGAVLLTQPEPQVEEPKIEGIPMGDMGMGAADVQQPAAVEVAPTTVQPTQSTTEPEPEIEQSKEEEVAEEPAPKVEEQPVEEVKEPEAKPEPEVEEPKAAKAPAKKTAPKTAAKKPAAKKATPKAAGSSLADIAKPSATRAKKQ